MSLNLYFRRVRPNGYVDFPIQTPTEISLQVMKLTNNCERLSIIEHYLYDLGWDSIAVDEIIKRIDSMMQNKNLTLMVC